MVSDSMPLSASPPGRYHSPLGAPVELTADGRLCLAGTGLLAGAVRNLRECLAWAVYGAGCRSRARWRWRRPIRPGCWAQDSCPGGRSGSVRRLV